MRAIFCYILSNFCLKSHRFFTVYDRLFLFFIFNLFIVKKPIKKRVQLILYSNGVQNLLQSFLLWALRVFGILFRFSENETLVTIHSFQQKVNKARLSTFDAVSWPVNENTCILLSDCLPVFSPGRFLTPLRNDLFEELVSKSPYHRHEAHISSHL